VLVEADKPENLDSGNTEKKHSTRGMFHQRKKYWDKREKILLVLRSSRRVCNQYEINV